jgi:thiosulfate reductase cytochrome b subunit
MNAQPDTPQQAPQEDYITLHPRVVRYAHWCWALGVIILIGSGWQIYNQEPLFHSFTFPSWLTIGLGSDEGAERVHNDIGLAGALLWHFAAMWLLFISLTVYVIYGFVSGHFRKHFTPIWPRQVLSDVFDFFRGRLDHRLGVRNAVQKLLYIFAVLCMILMVWSGLVLWKPEQFEEIGVPLGHYEGARYIHFFGMAGIVLFIIVHIALTLIVPKVLPPMITGRARRTVVAAEAGGDAS